MTIKLILGSAFPHTVSIADEQALGPDHSWASLANWCDTLMGDPDTAWTLSWDAARGMVYAFRDRIDASLFHMTWTQDQ